MNRSSFSTGLGLIHALIIILLLSALSPLAIAGPPASDQYDSIIKDALKLEEAGKVQEALDLYILAMPMSRDRAEPWARASILQLILNKPKIALATATRAVDLEPAHRGAWLNKSVIELASGMNKEALSTTQKALKRFPEDTDLMNNMATALIGLRKYNTAEDLLLEALKIKPSDSSIHYNLACTYALSDIKMTALIYLEKAIALDPSLKKNARTDPDLRKIRDLKPFKELTSD
ncbi:tetratricopeptide repeat protein [Nitrospirota bacterium]